MNFTRVDEIRFFRARAAARLRSVSPAGLRAEVVARMAVMSREQLMIVVEMVRGLK